MIIHCNGKKKDFLINSERLNILDSFFSHSEELNINLLHEDKRWLKTICYGISRTNLIDYLSEYIDRWHQSMELEPIVYKKQNYGRRAANKWLRETIRCIQEDKNN